MPRVIAQEQLDNPEYCGSLTMTEFYDLLLAAGYPETTAQAAANRRGQSRLDAGLAM